MAPSRERSSRPSRRLQGHHSRPFKPRPPASYSHINIQPAPDSDQNTTPNSPSSANFVTRPSIQDTIAEELAYAKRIASTSSHNDPPPGNHPTTFAEAAMSTRVRGTMGGSSRDSERMNSPIGSRFFESLGILKHTKKRKKAQKWSMLDLSGVDDVSEAASNGNASEGLTSHNASPALTIPALHPTKTPPLNLDQEVDKFRPNNHADIEKEVSTEDFYFRGALEPAYTQPFVNAPSIYHDNLQDDITSVDPLNANLNDSLETKKNFDSIMAHLNQYIAPTPTSFGEDAFDSITWDPDLPHASSSTDKSPEKLDPKPKPVVAYTTVGSVVNPNNVPQFSAPNRIQREGAGRRPLMSMSNRQYDSLLHPRGLTPPLSMQSSMQYTQHLLQIPPTYDSQKPRISMPNSIKLPPNNLQLTEQEKQVLGKLDEAIQRIPVDIRKIVPVASSTTSTASGSTQAFRSRAMLNDEEAKRAYGANGLRQGLEKMQTLQRLARFENPMREHALSRLSEFSVANNNTQAASKSNNAPSVLESMMCGQYQSTEDSNQGEFDKGFQFPPPGLASSSTTATTNPLYGAYASSAYNNPAPLSRPPGYPQPLTAGPPGQRQASQSFLSARLANSGTGAADIANNVMMLTRQSSGFTSYANTELQIQGALSGFTKDGYMAAPTTRESPVFEQNSSEEYLHRSYYDPFHQSPWVNRLQLLQKAENVALDAPAVAPAIVGPHTYLYDTISPEMMAKYYPNGAPTGRGYYLPISKQAEMKHRSIEQGSIPQKSKSKKKDLDDFFYYGQRRYHMTAEEHIVELERRETNPFGPIGPPRKNPVTNIPVTSDEVEKMTVAEAVKPAIDGLFGTLLSFAESSENSRTMLSRWVKGPARYIDDTVEGNRSCFGEDWGKTIPKP